MDRRTFVTMSGATAAAAMIVSGREADAQSAARDYYELRKYHFETDKQKSRITAYFRDAAIPALNQIGVGPVGVFEPVEADGALYVLLCHRSAESYVTATQKLLANKEYLAKAESFLNATLKDPAYTHIEVSFMVAFTGMTSLQRPVTGPDRIFEMRNYQSPTVKTGQKKIEMFNAGEIGIMQRVGMGPVFYGEHLAGPDMPNLTYMLSYNGMEGRKESWGRFGPDAEWKKMSGMQEYKDLLSGINATFLKPFAFSQI